MSSALSTKSRDGKETMCKTCHLISGVTEWVYILVIKLSEQSLKYHQTLSCCIPSIMGLCVRYFWPSTLFVFFIHGGCVELILPGCDVGFEVAFRRIIRHKFAESAGKCFSRCLIPTTLNILLFLSRSYCSLNSENISYSIFHVCVPVLFFFNIWQRKRNSCILSM